MIRLLVSDLREHAHVWFAALLVAMAFGYVGGSCASFAATAAVSRSADAAFFFNTMAQAVFLFSAVSACVVISSVSRACVVSLRRVYALWQLIGVSPRMVSLVVGGQVVLVTAVGACCGCAASWASLPAIFGVVFKDETLGTISPGISSFPLVIASSIAIAVLGGLRASRCAARVDPVLLLRDERALDAAARGMSFLRWMLAVFATALAAWRVSTVDPERVSIDSNESTWLIGLTLVVPAILAALSPLYLPRVLDALARLPFRSAAWMLARGSVRQGCEQGGSLEMPLLVSAGTMGGFYSMMGLMERYYSVYGLPVGSGFELNPRLACFLFGGPVALAVMGVCARVVLGFRGREHDAVLWIVLGARSSTVMSAGVLEAAMHVAVGGFLSFFSCVLSNGIAAWSLGLGFMDGLASLRAFAPVSAIALLSFALLLIAELPPLFRALTSRAGILGWN